jgi:hypothetical protein
MSDGSKLEPILGKSPGDGVVQGDPVPQPDGLAALRAALTKMDKAAVRAGIDPEDALAGLLEAIRAVMDRSAEITLAREARISETVAALTAANEAERLAMRSAADRCRAETQKLDKYSSALEVRAENLVTQTITSMSNKVAEEIKKRSVIVERQYNRRRLSAR